jgi:hypothetical protein
VTATVLVITLVEKFGAGGWLTVLVTGLVIAVCVLIRGHYTATRAELAQADVLFSGNAPLIDTGSIRTLDPTQPTAIVLVGKHRGISMHALLWVQRLFPGHFKNVIFLAVGEVDSQSYEGQEALLRLQQTIDDSLRYYVASCQNHGLAADTRAAFGTNPVLEFTNLVEAAAAEYPNNVCFASKLVFRNVNFLTAWLHNQTPTELQARLHLQGKQMMLLPMNVP